MTHDLQFLDLPGGKIAYRGSDKAFDAAKVATMIAATLPVPAQKTVVPLSS